MVSKVFLSILVPVYDWDISSLLKTLHEQCLLLPDPEIVEIIVVDDGSNQKFDNCSVAEQLSGVIYEELPENRGRAAIRNYLIGLSQGSYVLFLDADMLPDSEKFVQTYIEIARKGSEVVSGGISYKHYEQRYSKGSFHVYKSLKTEALPAVIRNRTPWRYVFTSNILLRSDILQVVRFDPRFSSYGFEDIEWAIRLVESYRVKHVDNTCSHMGVMGKEEVFARMREATGNQYLLYTLYPERVGSVGAIGMARILRCFPDFFLLSFDRLLSFLFNRLSWNSLLYLLFQGDKVILLSRRFKDAKHIRS